MALGVRANFYFRIATFEIGSLNIALFKWSCQILRLSHGFAFKLTKEKLKKNGIQLVAFSFGNYFFIK